MRTKNLDGDIFTIRLGLPGEGKSLAQTEDDVIPLLIEGLDVYCTYWINWNQPNLHLFTEFEEVKYVRNCVVVFDEIGSILDPRNWEAEDSGVRTFFQQHRHRAVDIIANTQHLSLIAKSALIEVKNFIMCTRTWQGWLLHSLWPNFPWVVIKQEFLNLQDLKRLDNQTYSTEKPENESTENLYTVSNHTTEWYKKKNLYHRELDEFKLELVHTFCRKCKCRQGQTIPKEKTYDYAFFDVDADTYTAKDEINLGFCPKHKDEKLIIVESSMYDTRYEVLPVAKKVVFRPFYKTLKEAPFKGVLTPDQVAERRELEQGVGN